MKVITCAGYYGSGSSAVLDLVSEYRNVQQCDDFEFRFLHDVDGVTDLEYHLVDYHNRHNAGHALKRFEKLAKFNNGNIFLPRYSKYFGDNYANITKRYIDRLKDFDYRGWWFYDIYDKGTFWYYILMLLEHFVNKISRKEVSIFDRELIYCSHPTRDQFLSATRDYVSELIKAINKTNSEYVALDQLVPSQNIDRVTRYFREQIYVIVVSRDPRDVYISNEIFWKSRVCPRHDVKKFCQWFRYTMESGSTQLIDGNEQYKGILSIRFEDLIYDYEESVKSIERFTGLTSVNHYLKFDKFNPKRSVFNTKIWRKYPEFSSDIEYIENELKEFLFDFDQHDECSVCGIDSLDKYVF